MLRDLKYSFTRWFNVVKKSALEAANLIGPGVFM
jgi:hypothetical protein